MNKKLVGTGLAIGLVAGAGAGLILEMSGSAGAVSTNAAAVSAVVDDTTGTSDTIDTARPDPSSRLQEVLKPLVDDGTITQVQADKVIAALAAARPIGGPHGGPMIGGHRGFGGHGGLGHDVVTTTLGITAEELRTAILDGQSIADLAVSKGKTAQEVIDAIVADATTRINTRVAAGDITQARADEFLADLTTHATEFVNSTTPVGGPGFEGRGFGGRGFGGRGHHFDDNDLDDAPVDTTATTDTVGS